MENYVITGSIGHISRPVIETLVKAGKQVSVITSSKERVDEIQKLGAKAIVGSVAEADFVKEAFKGADVIYTMIPPIWQTTDWRASQNVVANNYVQAILASGVEYVVNLSSIGAHVGNGNGPVNGLHDFEQMLNQIPGIHVKHIRPSYFYYNLLSMIPLIKGTGIIGGNFGDEEKVFLVHTNDIAAVVIEELLQLDFRQNSVRYVIGDERSGKEIAEILGKAIKQNLQWVVFSDEQQLAGLLQAGVPETHARNFTEMGNALRRGTMQEDARKNLPAFSSVKLEDFSREFAQAFIE